MNARNLQEKYGGYLILPLKYEADHFSREVIDRFAPPVPLDTMDITENVKAMLMPEDGVSVGSCHPIERGKLVHCLFGGAADADTFTVTAGENCHPFDFAGSQLWIFNTQVAFLCLGLTFQSGAALDAICCPGYADNTSSFTRTGSDGTPHPFSIEETLTSFCKAFELQNFFCRGRLLLEAFSYTLMLCPERFSTLENMRRITFNLHQMVPPQTPIEDASEADVRYVYAVKDQSIGSYRWGCCISSQTISYVVADADMDFEREMAVQAADGLPVVVLALYEKYTCLRFAELLTHMGNKQSRKLRSLKNMMLEFQAYGTVAPANLSRWHNVKETYAALLSVNDIPNAIQDITGKLNVLSEHQRTIDMARTQTVTSLITVFGIVSILASVLTILQILSGGNATAWIAIVLTILALVIITGVAVMNQK